MKFGISVVSADRFFGKVMRTRHARQRELADQLAQACSKPLPHTQLIIGISDEARGHVVMDLDDDIGLIDVGRDCSASYAPKDNRT